jgi:hypothetical protein
VGVVGVAPYTSNIEVLAINETSKAAATTKIINLGSINLTHLINLLSFFIVPATKL